ncbi:MAG: hypothetical protein LBP91_03630 [Coriobacteriales bacterium]|nr:hypothetical protein [Coriobacteriales bacterium]
MARPNIKRRGCGCLGIGSFGLGTIVAVVISWTTYHDVLWTIVHGFLSWAFIIWYLIFH